MESKNLPIYVLANKKKAFYLTLGSLENNQIPFLDTDGKKKHRDMVGYRTVKKYEDGTTRKRFWHFSVEARPMLDPFCAFQIKYHVIFSDDGKSIWESKDRLHRARRSQCKDWWNAAWRDRTLAVMSWLSDADGTLKLAVGADLYIEVNKFPVIFRSPVFYLEPGEYEAPPEGLIQEEDEEDEEEESGEEPEGEQE